MLKTLQGLGDEKTFIQLAEEEDSLLRNGSKSVMSALTEKFMGKHQAVLRKFTLKYPMENAVCVTLSGKKSHVTAWIE